VNSVERSEIPNGSIQNLQSENKDEPLLLLASENVSSDRPEKAARSTHEHACVISWRLISTDICFELSQPLPGERFTLLSYSFRCEATWTDPIETLREMEYQVSRIPKSPPRFRPSANGSSGAFVMNSFRQSALDAKFLIATGF